ncbi:hypothetical protein [Hyphomicrobium sp.]|uniref:hypothetical protein n=1 Tax=Hyphomicrobium sp. TaxID=82 RepID=UPI0025C544F8|nr:hypothetical protein [Hyphomicrobium sp.]MCC7251604.1 hypothetical protein [Hyphomicrobium sp.]
MSDKVRTNHLRRLAHRAGLRISTLNTPAGRIFAVIDGSRIVVTCVGFEAVSQQLAARQQAAA